MRDDDKSARQIWRQGVDDAINYLNGSTFQREEMPTVRGCMALLHSLKENQLCGPQSVASSHVATSERHVEALKVAKQALQDVREFTIGEQAVRGHLTEQQSYVRRINGCETIAKNAQSRIHELLGRDISAPSATERRGVVQWPKEKIVGRMGEMAPKGDMNLLLCLQDDGDVIVEVYEVRHNEGYRAQAEFCTVGPGGGKSPRTREALIALMVAIEADNAESAYRAWPPIVTTDGGDNDR